MAEQAQVAPTMTPEEIEAYREELKAELAELEHAQSLWPTEYKMDRMNRIRQRLGMPSI